MRIFNRSQASEKTHPENRLSTNDNIPVAWCGILKQETYSSNLIQRSNLDPEQDKKNRIANLRSRTQRYKASWDKNGVIQYKTESIAILQRTWGAQVEFIIAFDDLTKEGYKLRAIDEGRSAGNSSPGFTGGVNSYFYFQKMDQKIDEEIPILDVINNDSESIDSLPTLKLMIGKQFIKKYEYFLEGIERVQDLESAENIVIHPLELENTIEFQSKDSSTISFLPLSWITKIDKFTQDKDLLVEIFFTDDDGKNNSITIEINDTKIPELIEVVQSTIDANTSGYWNWIEIPFKDSDSIVRNIKIYPKIPFLTPEEEILWINYKTTDGINQYITYIQVITNFRIFEYRFSDHKSNYILLSSLEKVIITNKKTNPQSIKSGEYLGRGIVMTDDDIANTLTTGDLIFIFGNKQFFKFSEISEPDRVAKLINTVKNQMIVS